MCKGACTTDASIKSGFPTCGQACASFTQPRIMVAEKFKGYAVGGHAHFIFSFYH